MIKENLEILMISRGLSASDIARAAGVSRQAVSRWFHKESGINIMNIEKITSALSLKSFNWFEKTPRILEDKLKSTYEAQFIWDRVYPSLTHFASALAHQQPQAMGRLVEILGLYGAERVIGKSVWSRFHHYKKYISPRRRSDLEKLWQTLKDLALI